MGDSVSNYKHGKRRTRVYGVWTGIKNRCRNPNEPAYPNYGGRGIDVCERWNSFEAFYADMGDPLPGQTIERVDNNKGYSPDNCIWADRITQARNRRNARIIELGGKRLSVPEWAELMGLPARTIRVRLSAGWPEDEAVMTPKTQIRKGIKRGEKLRNYQGIRNAK